ncbi:MAG: flagellar filament capping protein FliD, partial [Armatimonadetes bacterium]|nr:flagellar filament capping protein FliD [Armatimonadota bacterium]
LDVAGTINGESATGAGQFLTGNKDNLKTEGLQIQYTGTATGNVGSIQYTRGAAALMTDRLNSYTLTKTGVLSANDGSLQEQYDDFTSQIADFRARVSSKEQSIRAKFQVMEAAIQRSQAQGSQLSAMFAQQAKN